MVFDETRNAAYGQAIREMVTEDTVVLDLGAGLGILGLMAAQAGARKVYLVEPQPLVKLAREIADINGLGHQIEIIEGRIQDVTLPEKVDLILSVMTGNMLFSEDLLPSLFYARDNYLKQDGKLIPDLGELIVAPVSTEKLHEKHLASWKKSTQGIDLKSVFRFSSNQIIWAAGCEEDIKLLSSGRAIQQVDFNSAQSADCHGEARFTIDHPCTCHGLLCWIRIRLGSTWLDSGPASIRLHWSPAFLPVGEPVQLEAHESLMVSLQRPSMGDWTWTLRSLHHRRRHSTFLSRIDSLDKLKATLEDVSPRISRHGENTLLALTLMKQNKTNREIALALHAADPETYQDFSAAMRTTRELLLLYSKS